MHSTTRTALGTAAAIHRRTVDGLVQRVYGQPLISNVDRGAYVEHMVEPALGEQQWRLTWPWASWDLEHCRWQEEEGPRIEIKQSAARAPDHAERRPNPPPPTRGRFSIKPRNYFYLRDGTLVETPLRRHADLYLFAWHPEADLRIADHRHSGQWKFFVVAESDLPTTPHPPPKSMSITPYSLNKLSGAEQGCYEELPNMLANVLKYIPEERWKAVEDRAARHRARKLRIR